MAFKDLGHPGCTLVSIKILDIHHVVIIVWWLCIWKLYSGCHKSHTLLCLLLMSKGKAFLQMACGTYKAVGSKISLLASWLFEFFLFFVLQTAKLIWGIALVRKKENSIKQSVWSEEHLHLLVPQVAYMISFCCVCDCFWYHEEW